MNPTRWLRSRVASFLFSFRRRAFRCWLAEQRRRLLRRPHVVHVFLELDDPYSYLLGAYLPELSNCYDIELRLHLTQALGDDYRPQPDMLAVYGQLDCARVAAELGVPFLDKGPAPPVEHRRTLIEALAKREHDPGFADDVIDAIGHYWRGDAEGVGRRVSGLTATDSADEMLARNQGLLEKFGHYNTATLFYAGEWYWGVDRLHYLVERLDELGARREGVSSARLASIRQVMQMDLPIAPPAAAKGLPPLEFFLSFRSPYSYLAIGRVVEIANAFGLELKIRPVLPMVMRGMQVPMAKIRYIASDVAREANRLGVPIARISDPVGPGAERCLATFFYALGEKRERDFIANAGRAIWVDGIDVATDKGMRKVTARTGLFWPDAKAAMAEDGWRAAVEQNRESMMESGSWGVPTLRFGDFVVWGQDRDWLLVRHIEDCCDTGDGILI